MRNSCIFVFGGVACSVIDGRGRRERSSRSDLATRGRAAYVPMQAIMR